MPLLHTKVLPSWLLPAASFLLFHLRAFTFQLVILALVNCGYPHPSHPTPLSLCSQALNGTLVVGYVFNYEEALCSEESLSPKKIFSLRKLF